jgi:hypothetical protein
MARAEAGDSACSTATVPIAETLKLITAVVAKICSIYCWEVAIRALLECLRDKSERLHRTLYAVV